MGPVYDSLAEKYGSAPDSRPINVFTKIDVDEQKELARTYQITA